MWIARKPIMTALGFEAAGLAGIVLFIGSCEAPVACKAQGRMTPRPTEYVLLVGAQYAPRRSCTFDSVDVPQQRSSAHATLMIYIYIYMYYTRFVSLRGLKRLLVKDCKLSM